MSYGNLGVNSWKGGDSRILQRIWRGEGWPEKWKEGVIISIVKKGEGKRVENIEE